MTTKNINTGSLQGLIPVDIANEILRDVADSSAVMRLGNMVPMNGPIKEFPVELSRVGQTYWVSEGEKIKLEEASWKTIRMEAKKLAVIVPVTREALSDGSINIFQEVKRQIADAFARKFDEAALFGTDSPWGSGKSIVEYAKANGKVVTATNNVIKDLSDVMGVLEDNEIEPNAFVSTRKLKAKLRNAENGAGYSIFEDKTKDSPERLHGMPLMFTKNFDKEACKVITGDFDNLYFGILDDIEYQISTDGTVGNINLFEQDMTAIKATLRIAYLAIKDDAFSVITPATRKK